MEFCLFCIKPSILYSLEYSSLSEDIQWIVEIVIPQRPKLLKEKTFTFIWCSFYGEYEQLKELNDSLSKNI